MPVRVIIGAQWGDEGKGKVTDYFAKQADIVCRFQGGNNAGHTIVVDNKTYKFHIMPSGVLHERKTVMLGNGMVIDPEVLLGEIKKVKEDKRSIGNLLISERAHIIMPYHLVLDGIEEKMKGAYKAGTTKRGIGPAYTDKIGRFGLRMGDIIDEKVLKEKLDIVVAQKQKIFDYYEIPEQLDKEALFNKIKALGEQLRPYITNTMVYLNEAVTEGRNVLLEGAQGTHLDIDHGIYPYTTSSNTVAGGACTGTGIPPSRIDEVIGIVKGYTTRVGVGPVPTELFDEVGEHLATVGGEFGATTGRARRCGWLDMVLVRYAAMINGFTSLVITKVDVLSGLDPVKVCTYYDHKREKIVHFPANMKVLAECKPIYHEFKGWPKITKEEWREMVKKGYGSLPKELKAYLEFIAADCKTPVGIVSVGPERELTIHCE